MMKTKDKYNVTATCRSAECKHTFTVLRREIIKINTGGSEYQIEHLVCPVCLTWAKITKIEKAGQIIVGKI